jgi:hypothetical protein
MGQVYRATDRIGSGVFKTKRKCSRRWNTDGIVFGQFSKGILRVSANGGQPTVSASVKSGEVAPSPQVLPGGEITSQQPAKTPKIAPQLNKRLVAVLRP